MILTSWYWWLYVGDNFFGVGDSISMLVMKTAKTVTNISKLSATHFVSNIDVAHIKSYPFRLIFRFNFRQKVSSWNCRESLQQWNGWAPNNFRKMLFHDFRRLAKFRECWVCWEYIVCFQIFSKTFYNTNILESHSRIFR